MSKHQTFYWAATSRPSSLHGSCNPQLHPPSFVLFFILSTYSPSISVLAPVPNTVGEQFGMCPSPRLWNSMPVKDAKIMEQVLYLWTEMYFMLAHIKHTFKWRHFNKDLQQSYTSVTHLRALWMLPCDRPHHDCMTDRFSVSTFSRQSQRWAMLEHLVTFTTYFYLNCFPSFCNLILFVEVGQTAEDK